jgi:hypothetical protein
MTPPCPTLPICVYTAFSCLLAGQHHPFASAIYPFRLTYSTSALPEFLPQLSFRLLLFSLFLPQVILSSK